MRRSECLCNPHVTGVVPWEPLFYAPNCTKCRELLAQGKRTGNEPAPPGIGLKRRRRAGARIVEFGRVF